LGQWYDWPLHCHIRLNDQLFDYLLSVFFSIGLHPTNVRYEPAVYAVTPRSVAKDSTCIAMTRALGDFYAHQFGLTWVPSITTRRIAAGIDYSILLASDGIWDCWKYEVRTASRSSSAIHFIIHHVWLK
jgi:serine/threonine protein phosphatase PrpC